MGRAAGGAATSGWATCRTATMTGPVAVGVGLGSDDGVASGGVGAGVDGCAGGDGSGDGRSDGMASTPGTDPMAAGEDAVTAMSPSGCRGRPIPTVRATVARTSVEDAESDDEPGSLQRASRLSTWLLPTGTDGGP